MLVVLELGGGGHTCTLSLTPSPDFILLSNSILSSICILYSKEGDFHLTNMIGSYINK
jgi:hypothetical protein